MIKRLLALLILSNLYFRCEIFANDNFSTNLAALKIHHNLSSGCFKGDKYKLVPYSVNWNTKDEFLKRVCQRYPYLYRALKKNGFPALASHKYIFIYDKTIDKKEFDTIKFQIPEKSTILKITHLTDYFETGDFTYELFLFNSQNSCIQKRAVMKNLSNEFYENNGIIMKSIVLDSSKYDTGLYVVSNYKNKRSYAILFEFL